jgi:hypothetical protein
MKKKLSHEDTANLCMQCQGCQNDLHQVMAGQLERMREDIAQVKSIVDEASRALNEGFRRIAMNVAEQAALVQNGSGRLSAISRDIDRDCNLAVTALQFEDMVRQVLAGMDKRVLVMQSTLAAFEERENVFGSSSLAEIHKSGLSKAGELLNRMREDLAAVEHRAVEQQNMTAGDVELFR